MSTVFERHGKSLVVAPVGHINSANAAALEAELLSEVAKVQAGVALDLAQVDYISSAGLRVVLLLAKKLRQDSRKLVLCSMQPQVLEVFDISGFLAILSAVDSRTEALALLDAD